MEPMLQYCLYDICRYYECIVLYCKYITYRLYTYTRLCIKCGAIKTTELRRLIWHLSKKLFLHLDFFIQGSPQCQIWQGNVEEGVWAAHTAWRAAEREELGGCKLSPRSVQAPAKLGLCSAFPLFTTLPLPPSQAIHYSPWQTSGGRRSYSQLPLLYLEPSVQDLFLPFIFLNVGFPSSLSDDMAKHF